jgi:tRNA pseudouridine32 synthase/23S rRNA pseudouridine746 synthase/23S rRNA pseudouridine1911/1915/1917 synthase
MKAKIREQTALIDILQNLSPDSSKNNLKSWVEQGRVLINGRVVKKVHLLVEPGQEVTVGPKASFADEGIRIVYEDRYLVVLDKPEKILSVASLTQEDRTVHAILKRRLGKLVYAVHRLDRDTSGLMMFTYTPAAKEAMKKQFETHEVSRIYLALIEGTLEEKQGTWKSFLQEDANYKVYSAPTGDLAITHYEVIGERPSFSCVRLTLETGRKNQIRVHSADAGHPVIGDKKYGARTNPYKRLCLHAMQLEFFHPVLKKKMSFKSQLPAPFLPFLRG